MSELQRTIEHQQMLLKQKMEIINIKIEDLGYNALNIYDVINTIATLLEKICNFPLEERNKYKDVIKNIYKWKLQADKLQENYENIVKCDDRIKEGNEINRIATSISPSAAMGATTVFGVASTGTATTLLSGTAVNTALAWLGGRAFANGAMAVGDVLLDVAGPIGMMLFPGWTLAGGGLIFIKSLLDKKKYEQVVELIGDRDIRQYNLVILEIKERIGELKEECSILDKAISNIMDMGTDYTLLSEMERYELASYFNVMESSLQLLVEPILGLQEKYTEKDYNKFMCYIYKSPKLGFFRTNKDALIVLANMLYGIDITKDEIKVLYKVLRSNNVFLRSIGYDKYEFDIGMIYAAVIMADYSYNNKGEKIVPLDKF